MVLSIDNLSQLLSDVNSYCLAMHHLVGVAEVAAMLGVSRQRVNKIVKEDESFPRPEAELAAGRIWRRDDIEQWARSRGRMIRPPPDGGDRG